MVRAVGNNSIFIHLVHVNVESIQLTQCPMGPVQNTNYKPGNGTFVIGIVFVVIVTIVDVDHCIHVP